jgi:putative transposase
MKGRSKLSKTKQDNDCTMSSPIFAEQLILPLFAIAESQAPNKKMTCKDKSPICSHSTQKQKSSKTLEVDLILKEKVCAPYWTDFCEEISSRLLLPVETDCVDSDSSLYSTWSNKTVEKSWFSTNLFIAQKQNSPQIFSASSTFSLVGCTDSESTVRKSKKIKICLNQVQKNLIKRWAGTSRFVFNETVKYLQQPNTKANWKAIKTEIIHGLPEWSTDIPYQIKSIAIKDACIAVQNAKKKFKQTGKINKVKFRSRRDKIQSCYIPKSAVTDKGIYHTKLGSIRFTEKLPTKIGDCRLVSHLGITYLSVPHDVPHSISENQGRVVALDPGVRSFMTLFSETSFGWLGQYDIGRIQRLCYYLDDLISRTYKTNAKKRYRMRKAADKIRFKIKNLVDELHHKIARFLVDNFDIILLPTFETSQMAIKKSRKIRAKSVRQMLTLSHYRFKQFLKHKAFETGKLVLDVNEAYTSKTVSWTGEIIQNLGGRKKIKSSDGRVMDRDLNGGRGIFLRSLVDNPSLFDCIVNVS